MQNNSREGKATTINAPLPASYVPFALLPPRPPARVKAELRVSVTAKTERNRERLRMCAWVKAALRPACGVRQPLHNVVARTCFTPANDLRARTHTHTRTHGLAHTLLGFGAVALRVVVLIFPPCAAIIRIASAVCAWAKERGGQWQQGLSAFALGLGASFSFPQSSNSCCIPSSNAQPDSIARSLNGLPHHCTQECTQKRTGGRVPVCISSQGTAIVHINKSYRHRRQSRWLHSPWSAVRTPPRPHTRRRPCRRRSAHCTCEG